MKTPKAESAADLHSVLVHNLGLAIAEGTLAPHSILRLDELEAQHSVSRSVVREATRVLSSKGMLESRRRLGTVVQPEESWNAYDPQVIRWRLASSKRLEQLQALNELRGAIEPQAARLAAERASWDAGSDLVSQAARLWAAGQRGDHDEFLRLDIEFHAAVLKASGNRHVLPAAQPRHRGPDRAHRARPDAAPAATTRPFSCTWMWPAPSSAARRTRHTPR